MSEMPAGFWQFVGTFAGAAAAYAAIRVDIARAHARADAAHELAQIARAAAGDAHNRLDWWLSNPSAHEQFRAKRGSPSDPLKQ